VPDLPRPFCRGRHRIRSRRRSPGGESRPCGRTQSERTLGRRERQPWNTRPARRTRGRAGSGAPDRRRRHGRHVSKAARPRSRLPDRAGPHDADGLQCPPVSVGRGAARFSSDGTRPPPRASGS
jgi:hypothetical protein